MCSCRVRSRSCTPTSTRSTPRSSSATTRGCAGGRSSSAAGSCSPRATRPRRCGVRTAMGGAEARRLCPQAVVVSPRMSAYSEASKAVFEVFADTTPLVEGLSIDEAFLDVRGLRRIAGPPMDIAVRLRREVLERVGLPITVGVARTKFLAKVASGVAKPDGLLVVPPDGELAFLHPLPVERLWGVGPVTAGKLHDRGITTVGAGRPARRAGARRDARPRGGAPAPRAGPQPRSAAGAGRRPPALDGRAARARPRGGGRPRSSTPSSSGSSTASPAGCAPPGACAARSCCACASTTSRARPARTRCPTPPSRPSRSSPRRGRCWRRPCRRSSARASRSLGVALDQPRGRRRRSSSCSAFERRRALDAALDSVRDRFGTTAITRAVLLGRDQGLAVPLLPD